MHNNSLFVRLHYIVIIYYVLTLLVTDNDVWMNLSLATGLEKVLISPWLVTLLHICGVIPTPQSLISPETPRRYRRYLCAITDVNAPSADVSASSADIVASNNLRMIADVAASNADISTSSADIVASNDECFMMFHNVLSVLWCFTSGSRCITMFYMCFMMFYDV